MKKRNPRGAGSITGNGYRIIGEGDSNNGGTRRGEHVLVAEKALGRKLPEGVEVHHVDEVKLNNEPSNLVICPDRAYHMLLHRRTRALDACGHADWLKCPYCKQYDAPENMRIKERANRPGSMTWYHVLCHRAYAKMNAERKAA